MSFLRSWGGPWSVSLPQLLMPLMGSRHIKNIVLSCPVVTMLTGVGYGQVFTTCLLFAPRVTRRHGLVSAQGPRLTVVFLTFSVLAQGGEGGQDNWSQGPAHVPPTFSDWGLGWCWLVGCASERPAQTCRLRPAENPVLVRHQPHTVSH